MRFIQAMGMACVLVGLPLAAAAPVITQQPASQTVVAGQTATFTVVMQTSNYYTFKWYRNGIQVSSTPSPLRPSKTSSYTTPATTVADNGAAFTVTISLFGNGSVTSAPAVLTVGSNVGTPPAITAQPANATVTEGSTATFSVTASGTAPLSYQWRKNGINIIGATFASYLTPATVAGDNGATFSVVVTNSAGSATSNNATLTVNPPLTPPTITSQPVSQTVTVGQTATFSVTASGAAPLTYQWRKNNTNISGATSASYTTPPTVIGDNGATFYVIVTNSNGWTPSNNAILTVNAATATAPTITTQPVSQTVTVGQTATFSVTASGTAPLSYQWKKNAIAISGATGASYTTPATVAGDNGATFSVVVTNSAGSATSNNAVLTVATGCTAPTITAQPVNVTVTAPAAATFSVAASGTSPAYQWYRGTTAIAGATAATYTLNPTATTDSGATFSVLVSNACGGATSATVTLTVSAAPAQTLTWKMSMVYGFGQLLSEETATSTVYIQSDHVGSPNIITNSAGIVVGRSKNLPFGERFGQTGVKSIRRYTNHEDQDGSAIYMQARMYLPVYGKFAQVDPAYDQTKDDPESWNLYNYVTNNPVTNTDPDGRLATNPDLEKAYPSDHDAYGMSLFGMATEDHLSDWMDNLSRRRTEAMAPGTNTGAPTRSAQTNAGDAKSALTLQEKPDQPGTQGASPAKSQGPKMPGRSLTESEITAAQKVFGEKIDYTKVRVINGKFAFFQGKDYAVTPNGNIYYPKAPGDFTKGYESLKDLFIHEMTHVYQFQHGDMVKTRGFFLQLGGFLGADPYKVEYQPGKPFRSYNLEQQGELAVQIYRDLIPNIIP